MSWVEKNWKMNYWEGGASVMHSRVVTKFCLKLTHVFLDQINTKSVLIKIPNFSFNKQFWFLKQIFQPKTEKNEHHYWILHIQISLSTNFQLKPIIAIFWTTFVQKGSYFQSKTDKIDTTIEFCIFELVFVSNFTLNNFEFLDQICPRKIFMVKNRKSEHHHWIPHIQISLGTKFQLKLTILFCFY